jgi:hypothetical protein
VIRNLEAFGRERPLHGSVIAAGAFDRDQEILNGALWQCLPDLSDGAIEPGTIVFHHSRRDQNVAIKVAQHPLGAGLGTVNADDAEVFRSYPLDAGMNHTAWFVQTSWGRDRERL